MKIVNIILTSQNGGAEQVFIDYTSVLKNLGHELLVIVKEDAPYADKLKQLGVKVEKIKNNLGYFDFMAIKKIAKILQEFDADVVISHMGRPTVLARKAIKKIKVKKILQVAVNHSNNVKRAIGADLIFSVNKTIFFRTVELGQDPQKSFVIPNALDLSDAIEDAPAVDLRNKETIVIGAMGRIDRTKGFELLIKSLQILEKKSDKNFVIKIAGSGDYEQHLRALAKELNVEEKIEFVGWVKDKKSFFESIDIFCLPSHNESFGLVLLESMKYRKPIIAVDADGPKEILRNEFDGLLVNLKPIQNAEERIAPAIIRLVNDQELTNSLIKNSFKTVWDKFSYQALEKRMQDIFGKA